MKFKNLRPYDLAKGFSPTAASLEEQLAKQPLMPPSGASLLSRGWVPPVEGSGMVYSVGSHYLIALGVQTRVLPAAAVKAEVKERAKALEAQQGYKPGKKQLRDLTERVVVEMLPRAFIRSQIIRAWLDIAAGTIVVDAASANVAETLLEQLRNTLGELPVTRAEYQTSTQGAMTQWLRNGDAPLHLTLDSDCVLKGTGDEAATVRYQRHDLSVKEIKEHIDGGKFATRVGLLWRERMSLTLVEPFAVLRPKSLAMESGGDEGAGVSPADQFEADFTLLTGEYALLLADLAAAHGGRKEA